VSSPRYARYADLSNVQPHIGLHACLALAVLLLCPAVASAQLDTLNPVGMVGSAFIAPTWLSVPGIATNRRGGGGLRIGFRARTSRSRGWNRIRYGLDGSVIVTDLEGMSDDDPFAFASADVGPTLSLRVFRRVRSYATWRVGKQTMELRENGQVWNYAAGFASNVGLGVELPITPEGRGFDVGVQWLRGRFGSRDMPGLLETGTSVEYHAWRFNLGWSGPMTISAPWR
jgi:hypothetical protein